MSRISKPEKENVQNLISFTLVSINQKVYESPMELYSGFHVRDVLGILLQKINAFSQVRKKRKFEAVEENKFI